MIYVSVTEMRKNLRSLLERTAAGEEIVITRQGEEIARLVPPRQTASGFPDLTEFRESIKIKGEPLSETVIRQRREARY